MRDDLAAALGYRAPRSTSREGRILLLAEVARALLDGREPSIEGRLFVGAALDAWLRLGGAFEKHARVGAKRGSHRTAQALFRSVIGDERQNDRAALDSGRINNEGPE